MVSIDARLKLFLHRVDRMRNHFKLNLNLSEKGFNMFFRPYQRVALEILWNHPGGLNTREVWMLTNEEMSRSISRASIINFLNDVAEHELLDYREGTGKGGYRRYYWHKYDRNGFSGHLKEVVSNALKTLEYV